MHLKRYKYLYGGNFSKPNRSGDFQSPRIPLFCNFFLSRVCGVVFLLYTTGKIGGYKQEKSQLCPIITVLHLIVARRQARKYNRLSTKKIIAF